MMLMVDFINTLGENLRCLYSELSRFFLPSSESVLSKMAIFPETKEGNVHIYNESARGWSLREANV